MVRWMCDVSVRDRVPSEEIRERMGIELVSDVIKRNRLRISCTGSHKMEKTVVRNHRPIPA